MLAASQESGPQPSPSVSARHAASADPMYGLRHVHHAYGTQPVLTDVHIDLHAGHVHGLVGQNGAGKSTIVKLLSGALVPVAGSIVLDGNDVVLRSPADARRLGVVTIHQDPQLFPDMDVTSSVLGIDAARHRSRRTGLVDRRRARGAALRVLESLEVDVDPDQPVRALSLAEQRLVEIAAAMAGGPRFLILDEVTASLEQQASARVLALVERLARQGAGVCFISHRLGEVVEHCDTVTVLREGRVVGSLQRPCAEGEIVERMLGDGPAGDRGRRIRSKTGPRPALLDVSALQLPSCGTEVSFQVREGEVLGMAGSLGSGAPDSVRVLGGAVGGQCHATLQGRKFRAGSPGRAARHGVCFLSGSRRKEGIIPEMSIRANMGLSSLAANSSGGLLPVARLSRLAESFRATLDIRMQDSAEWISTLSGGNQQKVLIARALAAQPKILCIDEPSQGVDIAAREQIHRLLQRFAADGHAVIVFSSDPEELASLCDRVAVFRRGHIAAVLEGESLTAGEIALAGVEQSAVGATSTNGGPR